MIPMLKFYEQCWVWGRKKSGVRHIGMRLYITSRERDLWY